jgi:methionine synthase I (cobalamin-dependent)
LNTTHPELVTEIHRRYIAAGAQILFTNTFDAGLPTLKTILEKRVACAQKSAEKNTLIVGDIGPSGLSRPDALDYGLKKLATHFREQAKILENCGAHALVLETFTAREELALALEAGVTSCCKIPVWASVSPRQDGTLSDGTAFEDWAYFLATSPIAVVGINCGDTLSSMIRIAKKMRELFSTKPLLVKPSVGVIYPVDAATFAREMGEAQNWAPCILGGCCGTTPATIDALRKILMKSTSYE